MTSSGELAERLDAMADGRGLPGISLGEYSARIHSEKSKLMREAAALIRTLSPRGDSIGSSGGLEKDIGSSAALSPRSAKCAEAGKENSASSWRILPPDETEIDGAEVCTIHSFTHDQLTVVADEVEENPLPRARLIAAAPDLYAALKNAETLIRFMPIKHPQQGEDKAVLLAMIDAALAKARGVPLTTEARYSGDGGKDE